MTTLRLDIADLESPNAPAPVPYAALVPERPGDEPLPLCLALHGGGSNRDFLGSQRPDIERMIAAGELPPMVFATASTGEMSWYLDHPDGSAHWETFVAEDFLAHIRKTYPVRGDPGGTLLTGISMGGYGALKIAFARPGAFRAVAALEPAVEPGLQLEDVRPRNDFFFGTGGPPELTGPDRDARVWAANQPACRLRDNAEAIRESGLAIYLEVGDQDCLNLHDGAEFLHRLLWDLDVPHRYHLIRGADHVGPSLMPRVRDSYRWLAETLGEVEQGEYEPTATEKAWMDWAGGGFQGEPPPPIDLNSPGAIGMLRLQFGAALEEAGQRDPTVRRHYGVLPSTGCDGR